MGIGSILFKSLLLFFQELQRRSIMYCFSTHNGRSGYMSLSSRRSPWCLSVLRHVIFSSHAEPVPPLLDLLSNGGSTMSSSIVLLMSIFPALQIIKRRDSCSRRASSPYWRCARFIVCGIVVGAALRKSNYHASLLSLLFYIIVIIIKGGLVVEYYHHHHDA